MEPQGPLREKLVEKIGAERVREGVAEAIPLPDASVAGVTVADAFHWFDRERALEEIRRVLRPRRRPRGDDDGAGLERRELGA